MSVIPGPLDHKRQFEQARPLKVIMLVADRSACGLYRMVMPSRRLRALGVDVTVLDGFPGKTAVGPDGIRRCTYVPPLDADVVVVQRPSMATVATAIPHMIAQGLTVVVELDDDLERVDPESRPYAAVNPATSPAENWTWLRSAVDAASHLICSTPALTRYKPGRSTVIPNYIPASVTQMEPIAEWPDGRVRVGWTGMIAMHPRDLHETRGVVGDVIRQAGAAFHVVGDATGVDDALGFDTDIPVTSTGWVDLSTYPALIPSIDVGIVPLARTPFNEAKSWLKGLEFAAAGVPFVASDTAAYRQLHDDHGIGLLARKPADWRRHLRALVEDRQMREELGASWRRTVAERLTIETNGWRWVEALTGAHKVRSLAVAR